MQQDDLAIVGSRDMDPNLHYGGTRIQEDEFQNHFGGDANYLAESYGSGLADDETYEIVNIEFEDRSSHQYNPDVDMVESYEHMHAKPVPSITTSQPSNTIPPSEFSTVSDLTAVTGPPPPSPFREPSPSNIPQMSRENLLKYVGLPTSHMSRAALVEEALKKYHERLRDQVTSQEQYTGSVRSVERAHVHSSALYNIDPAILQTFADAFTPDKTQQINRLRKELEESNSSVTSLQNEAMTLRSSQVELSNVKTQLEVENKELKRLLTDKSNALHDFKNHKIEMESYLKTHTEFFNSVQNTIKGLFLHETLYQETLTNLSEETKRREKLESELEEAKNELKEIKTKYKKQEKQMGVQNSELEKLRGEFAQNQQLLKDYDNVTELSRMKNELRKMKEKSMNLKNMQNILQNQRIKFFELQKDYKDLELQHDRLKELLAESNQKNDELRIKIIREKDTRGMVANNIERRNQSAQRNERMVTSYSMDPNIPRVAAQLPKIDSFATDKNRMISSSHPVEREDAHISNSRRAPRAAAKRDPRDGKITTSETRGEVKAKQRKYLEEKIKQIEKFSLMKKNLVPLNKEQEALLANEPKFRMQLKTLLST